MNGIIILLLKWMVFCQFQPHHERIVGRNSDRKKTKSKKIKLFVFQTNLLRAG